MTELINKLYKVKDNVAGKLFQKKSNELPSFYQTSNDFPAMNLFETQSGYKIVMAIPGFQKDDITLNYDNDILSIKVHYKGEQGRRHDTKEREQEFSILRSVSIPAEVDVNNIDATMENGLLTIQLPAKEVSVQKKSTTINVE